jgi:LysM repeat protein
MADLTYVVVEGDTLTGIARRHGTSEQAVAELNRLPNPHLVRIGRQLQIPAAAPAPAPPAPAVTTYVVVEGDTLTGIARRHGTSEQAIAELNRLPNPHLVRIGRQLQIPAAAPAAAAAPASPPVTTVQHTVASGENLSTIAKRYGTTVPALAETNKLGDPNRVRIGQVLTVTAAAPTPAAPPSVEELFARYSRQYGVSAYLVKAVAWQESGWKQSVVSRTGAVGVMQVQPATGLFAGQMLLAHDVDLSDVDHNVKAGVRFLAWLLRQTRGNETYAIAAYYQGLRSVRRYGLLPETRQYVRNVLALKKRFAAGALRPAT